MGLLQKAVVKASPEPAAPDAAGTGDLVISPPENRAVRDEPGETAGQPELEQKLREYHKNHPSFQGIILAAPPGDEKNTELFFQTASQMVRFFGELFPLSPENGLILVPGNMDRELLAHRLSKSLNTRIVCHFQADDPGAALSLLGPYWQDARRDP